jgi:PPOX class probable F420-dependent enzyme
MGVRVTGWASDEDALEDFLAEPNLCRIGTTDTSGAVHIVPAWFWWDGASFWIGAQAGDHKVANIRRSGRASVEVDSDIRRKRGIVARGTARLVEGAAGVREYRRISVEQLRRYQPAKPPTETADRMASKGAPVAIEIRPESIVSWGR